MRKVRDVMTSPVTTVSEGTSLESVRALFDKHSISGAPVVDAAGQVVGLISNTDLAGAAAGADLAQVMTPFLVDVKPDDDIIKLMKAMVGPRIHRVLVTENRKPVGIVTSLDLVKDYLKTLS